jgi:hypothetical protein
MNRAALLVLATMLLCGQVSAIAATNNVTEAESIQVSEDADYIEDDFAPILGIVTVFAIVIMLMLLGAGAAIALLVLLVAGGMVLLGILTTSTVTGFLTKRPKAAFKALFLQLGGVLGAIAGVGLAFVAAWLLESELSRAVTCSTGAVIGLVAGILLAFIFNVLWAKALSFLTARLSSKEIRPQTNNGGKHG